MVMLAPRLRSRIKDGVLLDTNLLLLLIIGGVEPRLIKRNERTREFDEADYEMLDQFVRVSARIVVTPNILTEVSNLTTRSLEGPHRSEVFSRLEEVIIGAEEHFVESRVVSRMPQFPTFGLTDLGILHLARGRFLVLTEDDRLADYLRREGAEVLTLEDIWRLN